MNKAVFLDRDGTINEEVDYLSRAEDFHMLPGVAEAIRMLRQHDWRIVVVTNQSVIARGYYTQEDVAAIHTRMAQELAEAGTSVDAIYVCPHRPDDNCRCRKPGTLLFEQAAQALDIDLAASVIVGDKLSDLLAATKLRCRSVLVLTGHGATHVHLLDTQQFQPDHVADDLIGAARWIVQR
jgi:histidinol-phosphate phosphatase family protein